MVGDDWIGGWGPGDPADSEAPLPVGRKLVLVVCCRGCGGFDVGRRDWREGDSMAYWECRACGTRWKEPMAVGDKKVRAILP